MTGRSRAGRVACAVVLAALATGGASAADRVLRGRRLVVADPDGSEARRSTTVFGYETATDIPGISDPTDGGATLTVVTNGGLSTQQSFALDASGWRPLGTTGYRYAGPTGADGDAVKRVVARVTPGGVALLKAILRGDVGTDPLLVVPPAPGTSGGLVLDVAGGDRFCVTLGGAAGGTVKADDARLWKVVGATAEAGCLTSTTTTTLPPVCGNGVREGFEQCDGADLGELCVLLGVSCGAPGGPVPCGCCADTFTIVPNGVPCCDGSPCIPVGPGHCQCGACGVIPFPTCGGACPLLEVCAPVGTDCGCVPSAP